jgi:BMFP domain-containing protein YqiC
VRREIDTLVKAQVERVLNELNVVQREEFDAVKEMASRAREENERLLGRVAELERQAAATGAKGEPQSQSTTQPSPAPPPFPANESGSGGTSAGGA